MMLVDNLRIVDATAQAATTLCALIHAAFAGYRDVLDPPSGAHAETPETIAGKLAHGGGLLAYVDDVPVAGVVYQPQNTHMYLGRLAVLPDYRGRGIGQRHL